MFRLSDFKKSSVQGGHVLRRLALRCGRNARRHRSEYFGTDFDLTRARLRATPTKGRLYNSRC